MVVNCCREGMIPPSCIWSTITEGGRLPRLSSQCLNIQRTRNSGNGRTSASHSRSLCLPEIPYLLGGCREFLQRASLRHLSLLANAFYWGARSRRLQIAHQTPAFYLLHFPSASSFAPGNYASSLVRKRRVCTTDFEVYSDSSQSSEGSCLTTWEPTPYSEGEKACQINRIQATFNEEGVTKAGVLSLSSSVSFLQKNHAVLIEMWTSLLPSTCRAATRENSLLSPGLISSRVLMSHGTSSRPQACSALWRYTSSSLVRTTLPNLRRSLSLAESSLGSFKGECLNHTCDIRKDSSGAKRSVNSSPVIPSSCDCTKAVPQVFTSPISQRRFFGGRAGGLKRRKPKKDPGVVIQTGLGRRQEFFWPVEARRTRVPLYQNSRPNLIFDQRFKRFMCMWYSNGVQVFRPFSCRGRKGGRGKHGAPEGLGIGRGSGTWERARAKAVALLKQLHEQGKLRNPPKPDICRSGVRGVYFDSEEKLWVATWNEHGLRRFKAFPTMEMGFDAAYQAAVAVRRQKLLENFMFCMQRNRRKSGRLPLK